MLKEVPLGEFYRLINHGPCVLVTSGNGDRNNIAPVAWTMPVNDDPPLAAIAISSSHYTAELIEDAGEFVINIPSRDLLQPVLFTGRTSGRNENKFRLAGLTAGAGLTVNTPHINECIAFIECRVADRRQYDGITLFIGSVLAARVQDDLYDTSWITEKAQTIHHLGGGSFAATGRRFKAR